MTDGEIERMTHTIAIMAATLRASGLAGYQSPDKIAAHYAALAREMYEAARDNVSGKWADEHCRVVPRDAE